MAMQLDLRSIQWLVCYSVIKGKTNSCKYKDQPYIMVKTRGEG